MIGRRTIRQSRRGLVDPRASGATRWVPSDAAGLILWLIGDVGPTVVMSGVTAAGTTPPAVTLTGTPNSTAYNTAFATPSIEIDITGAGTGPAATFQWKLNGTVKQTGQSCTATFVLGTTGLTANFPNSAYAANNVYTANTQLSAWADQSGKGNSVTQATSSGQPIYVVNSMNGHAITHYTSANLVRMDTGNILAGGNLPHTLLMASKFTSLNSTFEGFVGFGGSNTGFGSSVVGADGSNNLWYGGANQTTPADGAADTNLHINSKTFDGSNMIGYRDGVQKASGSGLTLAAGNIIIIGSYTDAVGGFTNSDIGEVLVYNRALGTQELLLATRYLGNKYGVSVQ